jgi:hypothetical protein
MHLSGSGREVKRERDSVRQRPKIVRAACCPRIIANDSEEGRWMIQEER